MFRLGPRIIIPYSMICYLRDILYLIHEVVFNVEHSATSCGHWLLIRNSGWKGKGRRTGRREKRDREMLIETFGKLYEKPRLIGNRGRNLHYHRIEVVIDIYTISFHSPLFPLLDFLILLLSSRIQLFEGFYRCWRHFLIKTIFASGKKKIKHIWSISQLRHCCPHVIAE